MKGIEMDLKEYERLKSKVDRLQREADRAEGILEEKMARLKEEFGCKTLDDARKLLKTLEEDADEAGVEYDDALESFKEKWGNKL